MRLRLLLIASLVALLGSGCSTLPPPAPAAAPPVEVPAVPATIRGSEESSALLDNFTAFIAAVDGKPVTAGRAGWNTPIELKPGHHYLAVEFRRGVFGASTMLELQAASGANYQLNHATDAQLFGHNSYCDFWITDLGTNQPVVAVKKAEIVKGN